MTFADFLSLPRRHPRLLRVVFWCACLAITVPMLAPAASLPKVIFVWSDKALHVATFAVLAWCGVLGYPKRGLWVFVGLALYGLAIELAQQATGYRNGDLRDALADLFGIGIGIAVARFSLRWGFPPSA